MAWRQNGAGDLFGISPSRRQSFTLKTLFFKVLPAMMALSYFVLLPSPNTFVNRSTPNVAYQALATDDHEEEEEESVKESSNKQLPVLRLPEKIEVAKDLVVGASP
jgi:glutaredoxin